MDRPVSTNTDRCSNRGDLQVIFYKHILELGIDVRLGRRVTDLFEDENEAGVVVNGERIVADCVLACNGVHSNSRSFIIGRSDKPIATGYAVFRAWFDGKEARKDPKLAWAFEGKHDKMETYIGRDVHCIIGTGRRAQDIVWTCTHKDTWDIAESWSYPGKIADVLKVVEGWDQRIIDLVKWTPESQLVDYKLVWRDPLPGWTSKHGRMILLGDSAHPFLPTSGQGAGQAVEDAGTIAICLEMAGKDRVQLALKTCEKIRYALASSARQPMMWTLTIIRYARATLAQKIGIETRDAWHNFDVEEFKKDKRSIEMPRPDWLFGHDPQEYAYEEFETAANAVLTGGPYTPRNVPPPGESHRTGDFTGKKIKAWVDYDKDRRQDVPLRAKL
ncbi:hypothetical protein EDD37DRAFT_634426 [Exophiala viscosa]|uniref:uncharacterized protein n=1 Tax=Exophiala viscosa TaxID=2486360 RepID=UPI00219A5AE9|nr:hypothetical protein EDD37DRAFT_634426 [Exophiala viscosa]